MPADKQQQQIELQENQDGSFTVVDPHPPVDDPTLTPVDAGQGAQGTDGAQGAQGAQGADGGQGGDDHDDDDDDAPLVTGGATDEALEAKRQARREERRRKKEAQRTREDGLRAQLDQERAARRQLEERIALVERKSDGADVAQLDAALRRATDAAAYYKSVISEATKKQDGDAVADATERMIAARNEEARLKSIRQAYTQRQTQPTAPDPQLIAHATAWQNKNKWYNPNGVDMDSRITLAVDAAVQAEGFDPRTPTYWEELSRRVSKVLPHRASDGGGGGDDGGTGGTDGEGYTPGTAHRGKQVKSPVAGGGRESGGADGADTARNGQKTYQLSKDRVDALKEAGLWDDPVARAKAIREYHAFDRRQAGRK